MFLNNISSIKDEDKICIIVFGNIASGKSTFSKNLVKQLPTFEHVCLDNIRVEIFKKNLEVNTIKRERLCEQECMKRVYASKHFIYETTGSTLFYKSAIMRIRANLKTVFVRIECPVHECLSRFGIRKSSGHFQVAPPYRNRMTISECITHFRNELYDHPAHLTLDSSILNQTEMIEEFQKLNFLR